MTHDSTKPKVFIDGEHGTTGLQILERIGKRDDIELLSLPHADRRDADARRRLLNEADVAILCLPDDAARESVAMVADGDTRIIDASTAHRTNPEWTFGFKELDANQSAAIAQARFVANPGCYSTGAIALLRPLTLAGTLPLDALVTINAVSGYSGGGKQMIAEMEDEAQTAQHFSYAHGLTHKHLPEIVTYTGLETSPIFTPAVGRFAQGMMVNVPLHMAQLKTTTRLAVHAVLAAFYADAEHVRVASLEESDALGRLDITTLAGTDTMDIHVFGNDEQINLTALLDNLGKGASGACVQSLDLMLAATRRQASA